MEFCTAGARFVQVFKLTHFKLDYISLQYPIICHVADVEATLNTHFWELLRNSSKKFKWFSQSCRYSQWKNQNWKAWISCFQVTNPRLLYTTEPSLFVAKDHFSCSVQDRSCGQAVERELVTALVPLGPPSAVGSSLVSSQKSKGLPLWVSWIGWKAGHEYSTMSRKKISDKLRGPMIVYFPKLLLLPMEKHWGTRLNEDRYYLDKGPQGWVCLTRP